MLNFDYNKELETIKKILGDVYKYHDFSMYMVDEGAIAGFSFVVYTRENLFEINKGTINRLQRYVDQFSLPYSIEIEEEDAEIDYDDSIKEEDGKTYIKVNLDENENKIVISNIDKLMERFKE